MSKTQGKNQIQTSQINQPQVKAEMSLAEWAQIQRLRAQHQVDDQRKENQKLKGVMSDVNMAMGNKYNEENSGVYAPSSVSPSVYSYAICSPGVHSQTRPKPPRPLALELLEIQEDRTKDDMVYMFPERILATREAKKPANELSNVEKEPITFSMYKKKRAPSPGERCTKDTRKDGALLALAHPTFGRRGTKAVSSHEEPSKQELFFDPKPYRHSTPISKQSSRLVPWEANYETCPERLKSCKEKSKPATVEKSNSRSGEISTTVGKMCKKPQKGTGAACDEKRHQKRLSAYELENEKLNKRKQEKRTRSEGARSCKLGSQYSHTYKPETPTGNIAPELLDLSENKEHPRSLSSTIHRVRSIVSKWKETEQNQDIQSKPCGLLRITPAQSFHTQPPYKPGLCCAPAFHPYLWLGQENPQHQPSTSLHMAVLNSNPDLKDVPHNQPLNNPILSPKEHTLQRLATITQELGKYFPIEKPTVKKVESYIEENEPSSMWSATVEAEEDELDEHTPSHEYGNAHRIQEIAEVAASDIAEDKPTVQIPERQMWLSERAFVPIPALSHVVAKYPNPEVAIGKPHREIVNKFDGQLCEELRKFGITSKTNSISDTTYNSISVALRKQQSQRMSHVHDNERNLMEFERGATLWQTQPVHSNSASVRSHQVHPNESNYEFSEDEGEEEQNPGRGEQSSEISELSDHGDGFHEAELHDKNQVGTRFMYPNSPKASSKGYTDLISSPQQRTHNVSRLCSSTPAPLNSTRTSRECEDEEEDAESLGLGEWESGDDSSGT
ncbi:uncharacterized protein [Physcomitrium patens]